jgi:lipoprotein-anchoring transpeptidase ErfK/SrfK
MRIRTTCSGLVIVMLVVAVGVADAAAQGQDRRGRRQAGKPGHDPRWLAAQVALDRAGFSPGEIDGRGGSNTERALRGFQEARGLEVTGRLDEASVAALGEWFQNPTTTYVVTDADVAGPFVEALPDDMMQLAGLDSLGYTSVVERLAERFHAHPALLARLNAEVEPVAGASLTVPNVEPFYLPAERKAPTPRLTGATVTVTETTKTVRVTDAEGALVFQAPVSTGSEQDPLPKGEWSITGTAVLPVFRYNPTLFWDADPSHAKATIAPGPNNPVGVAWIDLNREHMGFHGTPEPSTIGRAQSHGCLRLTNWDALRLAALAGRGTKVVLQ